MPFSSGWVVSETDSEDLAMTKVSAEFTGSVDFAPSAQVQRPKWGESRRQGLTIVKAL